MRLHVCQRLYAILPPFSHSRRGSPHKIRGLYCCCFVICFVCMVIDGVIAFIQRMIDLEVTGHAFPVAKKTGGHLFLTLTHFDIFRMGVHTQ